MRPGPATAAGNVDAVGLGLVGWRSLLRTEPAMRLLTAKLAFEFARILKDKRIQRVDIATAWATEGPALDALEETARRRKVRVRALVGVAGDHTRPDALKRLCQLGEVRLADGGSGLFHVKLYLFRGRRTSVAWIGSANFTYPGFGKNEEVLLETTDTADATEWFENRWESIDAKQSRKRLQEYCRTWQPPTTPSPDDAGHPNARSDDEDDLEDKIVFVQKGPRPPPLVAGEHQGGKPRGTVTVAGSSYPGKSAQDAQKIVFDELQRRDTTFLSRCNDDKSFHRIKTHFIAPTVGGLGSTHFQKYAKPIGNGWWMATQTQTGEKWNLILAAAKIAGLGVDVEGKCWVAEGRSREGNPRRRASVKVGF